MNEVNNIHLFVDSELKNKGFRIVKLTEDILHSRLSDIMNFVNSILVEHKSLYPLWDEKPIEWFANPMDRKFQYSYLILTDLEQIALLNFTSIYGANFHNHCTFVDKSYRGKNLAKLHMIKICQRGIDDGFDHYEGYWDKQNNGSIILHLQMGFNIQHMRKEEQLMLSGDVQKVKKKTLQLYQSTK